MAFQLIYTSVPRGLIPGRSGYTVAARHRQIRDRLATELERISSYTFAKSGASPVVFAHRTLQVSGTHSHVLTRIVDAGSDYTGRTNHLAQHLVCSPQEAAGCNINPAAAMLAFEWLDRYEGEPRYLDDADIVDLASLPRRKLLPAEGWAALRGSAADAALPLAPAPDAGGTLFVRAPESDLLELFAESLQLAALDAGSPGAAWGVPFTTFFQPNDDLGAFRWIGCEPDAPILARAGRRQVIDLANLDLLPTPTGQLAQLATSGAPPAPTARPPQVRPMAPPSSRATTADPKHDNPPAAGADRPRPDAATAPPAHAASGSARTARPAASSKLQRPLTPDTPRPAQPLVFSDDPASPTAPAPRSPLRNPRVWIPAAVAVAVGAVLAIVLVQGVDPATAMDEATSSALASGDTDAANAALDALTAERPSWQGKVAEFREQNVFPILYERGASAVTAARDAANPSTATAHLESATRQLAALRTYLETYPSDDASLRVDDLAHRLERIARNWDNRRQQAADLAARRSATDTPTTTSPDNPTPPEPAPPPADPHVPLPDTIYLVHNENTRAVTLPHSLPDLTHGERGARHVTLLHFPLPAGTPPWQLDSEPGRHHYKFPESAAEDDGRAMRPTEGDLDAHLRFRGASELQVLAPDDARTPALWGAPLNHALTFAGAESQFWLLLWDGSPLPHLPLDPEADAPAPPAPLTLANGRVSPAARLARFLATLTPAPGAPSPTSLAIRFLPPEGSGEPPLASEPAPLPLTNSNPTPPAVDFSAFRTSRERRIARYKADIEQRQSTVDRAREFLDWKSQCDAHDATLLAIPAEVFDPEHALARTAPVLDQPDAAGRRLAIKNFCADVLREFRRHLKSLDVQETSLEPIDESLSQDAFWAAWRKAQVDDAAPDEFGAFMENFAERIERLSSSRFRVPSKIARFQLSKLARAWEEALADEAGADLWAFAAAPRPDPPQSLALVRQLENTLVALRTTLAKEVAGTTTTRALDAGTVPPGTYLIDAAIPGAETRTLFEIRIPAPQR